MKKFILLMVICSMSHHLMALSIGLKDAIFCSPSEFLFSNNSLLIGGSFQAPLLIEITIDGELVVSGNDIEYDHFFTGVHEVKVIISDAGDMSCMKLLSFIVLEDLKIYPTAADFTQYAGKIISNAQLNESDYYTPYQTEGGKLTVEIKAKPANALIGKYMLISSIDIENESPTLFNEVDDENNGNDNRGVMPKGWFQAPYAGTNNIKIYFDEIIVINGEEFAVARKNFLFPSDESTCVGDNYRFDVSSPTQPEINCISSINYTVWRKVPIQRYCMYERGATVLSSSFDVTTGFQNFIISDNDSYFSTAQNGVTNVILFDFDPAAENQFIEENGIIEGYTITGNQLEIVVSGLIHHFGEFAGIKIPDENEFINNIDLTNLDDGFGSADDITGVNGGLFTEFYEIDNLFNVPCFNGIEIYTENNQILPELTTGGRYSKHWTIHLSANNLTETGNTGILNIFSINNLFSDPNPSNPNVSSDIAGVSFKGANALLIANNIYIPDYYSSLTVHEIGHQFNLQYIGIYSHSDASASQSNLLGEPINCDDFQCSNHPCIMTYCEGSIQSGVSPCYDDICKTDIVKNTIPQL